VQKLDTSLHPAAWSADGQREPITEPDWDDIDRRCFGEDDQRPGDSIPWDDVIACFGLILEWMCLKHIDDVRQVAARALTLHYLLSPETAHYHSLDEIAVACNTSKQCLSKSLMEFRRQSGLTMTLGKLASTSDSFRRGQLASIASGNHWSSKRTAKP